MNKMIIKICNRIFNTDNLPPLGGAVGGLTQTERMFPYLPTWEAVISFAILAMVGAVVGYLVKVLLDRLFDKK